MFLGVSPRLVRVPEALARKPLLSGSSVLKFQSPPLDPLPSVGVLPTGPTQDSLLEVVQGARDRPPSP